MSRNPGQEEEGGGLAVPASGLRALPAHRDLAPGLWGGHGPRSPALAVSGFQESCAILGELVRLQAQKSRLLGFSTRADSVLEMNMAKTSQVVATSLGNPASPSPSGDRGQADLAWTLCCLRPHCVSPWGSPSPTLHSASRGVGWGVAGGLPQGHSRASPLRPQMSWPRS